MPDTTSYIMVGRILEKHSLEDIIIGYTCYSWGMKKNIECYTISDKSFCFVCVIYDLNIALLHVHEVIIYKIQYTYKIKHLE